MPEQQKLFCLVNEGDRLTAYRADRESPWFVIMAASCHGITPEERAAAFNEVVKFQRTAFGPLAEFKTTRQISLEGIYETP